MALALLVALLAAPAHAQDKVVEIDLYGLHPEHISDDPAVVAKGLGFGIQGRIGLQYDLSFARPWWQGIPEIQISYRHMGYCCDGSGNDTSFSPLEAMVGGRIQAAVGEYIFPANNTRRKNKARKRVHGRDKFDLVYDVGPSLHLGVATLQGLKDLHFGGDLGLFFTVETRTVGIGAQLDQQLLFGNALESNKFTWTDFGLHLTFHF